MVKQNNQARDVLDKLGVRPGHAVAFANTIQQIEPDLARAILERAGRPPAEVDEAADLVLALVDETIGVVALLSEWRQRLQPAGGIWLLTAKRGQPGYVDQRDLIIAGQQAEVVDNKICSVSATTSAMRFVIRKKDR